MESNVEKIPEPNIKLDTIEDRKKVSQEMCSTTFDIFENIISDMSAKFTPEYMEQLSKKVYKDDREYPENFSNWYYHIIDFGKFKHAKIISNQIFTYDEMQLMEKTDIYDKVDWDSIEKILQPTLSKMEDYRIYNIKNGCFSNKFKFDTCLASKSNLAKQLWKINYDASLYGTGGKTELVVREFIPYNDYEIPTIYNGMPLREEIRVFYNMDRKVLEYMEDYWKYKYCRPNIHNKSDQIVFDWFHNKLKTRKTQHRELLQKLEDRIWNDISTLKFDDNLKGIWSIDFMYVAETDDLYLIDMARGHRSAYWNIDKLTYISQKEIIQQRRLQK